ncbi:MAG: hypothetical protein AAGA23_04965 [Pseudomonadota bacterium]
MRKWAALFLFLTVGAGAFAQDLELTLTQFRDEFDPTATGQSFGGRMDADGVWAVISAPENNGLDGSIYVFRFAGGWQFHKRLEDSPVVSNLFRSGFDVAISGEWIALSFSTGGVALYRRDQGGVDNWGYYSTVAEEDNASYRDLDNSNTVAMRNNLLAVGAPFADVAPFSSDTNSVGSVLIYELIGNSWSLTQQIDIPDAELIPQARFGESLDIQSGLLAVGSPRYNTDGLGGAGRAWVYQRTGGQFQLVDTLNSDTPEINARFGAVALGQGFVAVGSEGGAGDLTPDISNDGSIYIFEPALGGGYDLADELVTSEPEFIGLLGRAVAAEGNLVWAAAADDASYLFRRSVGGDWTEVDRNEVPVFTDPSNTREYGSSLALTREGTRIHGIVGDQTAENLDDTRVGAAFFYVFDDGLFSDSFED